MDTRLQYALFALGTLIILALLISAWRSTKRVKQKPIIARSKKAALKPKTTSPHEPTLGDLSENYGKAEESNPDVSKLLTEEEESTAEIDRLIDEVGQAAAQSSEPLNPGMLPLNPKQAKQWQQAVKESLERRLQKMETQPKAENPEPSAQELLIVYIMAPRGKAFYNQDVVEVLSAEGLQYGQRRLFHAYAADRAIQFSVASAVEPGYFDLNALHNAMTPGICFFAHLAEVSEPKEVFKRLLATVHETANQLGGDILDENRQRLTQSKISQHLARIKGIEAYRVGAAGGKNLTPLLPIRLASQDDEKELKNISRHFAAKRRH